MKFSVVVHKDTDTDYGVIVPDVPGCYSAGSTVSEALENVKEALSLHFEGLIEDGDPLPQPQAIDTHIDNAEFAGGIWAVVDFDVTPYMGKAVRFNASLPENLLLRIDDRVKNDRRYASRSGFLAAAALKELQGA
jgi:predicted RNase H-like HicB family nuclease